MVGLSNGNKIVMSLLLGFCTLGLSLTGCAKESPTKDMSRDEKVEMDKANSNREMEELQKK